ncbi:D-serine deaminase-like pyridoxal phosphate-dependent protein [Arthrobacter sp. CAN_A214]|uniref:alanine racemase n=1 Tax=Arthrobacter sp. CAN_A214 TaxID=2787720 RepID=UPI0018CA0D82
MIPDQIDTPSVMIDVGVLDANIARMASAMRTRGVRLRPHAKTHKVLEIGARQLAAGAVGLTVATMGEAETFAAGGAADLFIAYPLWVDARRARRLRVLSEAAAIRVGVDSVESAAEMGRNLGAGARNIKVLVEVDSGHHRSGAVPADVVDVARAAADAGLVVDGAFTFPGHSYAPGMPQRALQDEDAALTEASSRLRAAGFDVAELSGGSTPTALLGGGGAATELRPGVYVLGDAQQYELQRCALEDIALTVAATVVSRSAPASGRGRRVVVDSGSKILGSDRPAWATGYGRLLDEPAARIVALSEHHATIEWPDGTALPAHGQRLRVVPNHVCLTMNLVDRVSVVRDGSVEDEWEIAARGQNS